MVLGMLLGAIVWIGQDSDSTIGVVPDLVSAAMMGALIWVHVSRGFRVMADPEVTASTLVRKTMVVPAVMVGLTMVALGIGRFQLASFQLYLVAGLMGFGITLIAGYVAAGITRAVSRPSEPETL